MKMYHGDNQIDVHPDRVEEMKRKGWTDTQPSQAKPKKAKSKAIESLKENEDGES